MKSSILGWEISIATHPRSSPSWSKTSKPDHLAELFYSKEIALPFSLLKSYYLITPTPNSEACTHTHTPTGLKGELLASFHVPGQTSLSQGFSSDEDGELAGSLFVSTGTISKAKQESNFSLK